MKYLKSVLLILAAVSLNVNAEINSANESKGGNNQDEGFYVGASLGQFKMDGITSLVGDKTAFGLLAGYNINKSWSVDSQLETHFDSAEHIETKFSTWDVSAKYTYPFTDSFFGFVKGGVALTTAETNILSHTFSDSEYGSLWGLGLEFHPQNSPFFFRLQYLSRKNLSEEFLLTDVTSSSFVLGYQF